MSLDQLDLTTITAAILLGSGTAGDADEAARMALEVRDASLAAIKARSFADRDREQHPEPPVRFLVPPPLSMIRRIARCASSEHGATPEYAEGWNSALAHLEQAGLGGPAYAGATDEYRRGWNSALDAVKRTG